MKQLEAPRIMRLVLGIERDAQIQRAYAMAQLLQWRDVLSFFLGDA